MSSLKSAYAKYLQSVQTNAQEKPVQKSNSLLQRKPTPMADSGASDTDRGKLIAETAFKALHKKRQDIRNG